MLANTVLNMEQIMLRMAVAPESQVLITCNILSSLMFPSWLKSVLGPYTESCLRHVTLVGACQQNLSESLLFKLAYILLPEECGWVCNELPSFYQVWGTKVPRPVGVNQTVLRLLGMKFANCICVIAVLFIHLFILPKY